MSHAIYELLLTATVSGLVAAVTMLGVVVLPWTERHLDASSSAWLHLVEVMGSLFESDARPVSPVVAPRPVVELPEIKWDLAGDWTTVTGRAA